MKKTKTYRTPWINWLVSGKNYRKVPWSWENLAGFRWVDFPFNQSIEWSPKKSTNASSPSGALTGESPKVPTMAGGALDDGWAVGGYDLYGLLRGFILPKRMGDDHCLYMTSIILALVWLKLLRSHLVLVLEWWWNHRQSQEMAVSATPFQLMGQNFQGTLFLDKLKFCPMKMVWSSFFAHHCFFWWSNPA